MDVIDHHHANQDTAELGVELQDRPAVPPEFLAGNQLSDALEIAEAEIGQHLTGLLLKSILSGYPVKNTDTASINLKTAVEKFRRNVTPAAFEARLNTRIAKLLRPE
jgi:hypothetical protein